MSKKLEDWSTLTVPMGYTQNQKAYQLLTYATGREIVSSNVDFDELSTANMDINDDSCRIEWKDIVFKMDPEKMRAKY